jgi:phosphonate metabolism protein (transferase hexapeptide repeat family)
MAKLGDEPFIHENVEITAATFGRFVEIGAGSRVQFTKIGDYSYCDRYADIANAEIGKFANIAAFVRIGPTDHPMHRASLHHFLYRSPDYWDDAEIDAEFFAHRKSRVAHIGHDTWIGHNAVIRPEVRVGDGAVVASSAVVTKDVAPYTIVAGIPAKPIRDRFAPDIAERLMALAWWDWSHEALRERLDDFRTLPVEAFLEAYE